MRSFSANTMWSADAFALILEEDVVDVGSGDGDCVVGSCSCCFGKVVVGAEGCELEVFVSSARISTTSAAVVS